MLRSFFGFSLTPNWLLKTVASRVKLASRSGPVRAVRAEHRRRPIDLPSNFSSLLTQVSARGRLRFGARFVFAAHRHSSLELCCPQQLCAGHILQLVARETH